MIRRLALLHTVTFVAEMMRKLLAEHLPDLDSFHVVDESLLQDLMRQGGMRPAVVRRLVGQVLLAVDAGADLVLFTCSSTAPAVDAARKLVDVPIVKIDDPLAARAVELGSRIGVLVTAETTLGPSVDLVKSHAREAGKEVEVEGVLESQAFAARLAGDIERHDRLVRQAALDLARRHQVVVLAQASMAHLAEDLSREAGVPVLASPPLCIEALKARRAAAPS